jgi:2',3'-cyclic-nucleotide 2'-phosphodiesterase (5'-nucleotidase family)
VEDIWKILPFENYVVTARLTQEQLKAVMEEVYAGHDSRSLLGFEIRTTGTGRDRKVSSIAPANGKARTRDEKYLVAFNTFDSRSAGHRFMKLRAILETADAQCVFHDVQTRDALIDYFRRHRVVRKSDLRGTLAAAA